MTINPTQRVRSEHLTHPKYRADIDGLRAIAVLSVVGFHAFPKWIKGGFTGVDIFFVISGYLISTIMIGSLERNSFTFLDFYARRIKRIFPALLLILTACCTLGWFVLMADEYKQLGKHIAGGAGFVSNFLFWNESGYFDNAVETKPLLHLWSLGIEEQFYILWPLLLWFAWKIRSNLLTITIAVAVISFALSVDKVRSDTVAAFYSPQTRFWELMVGSVLAYMTLHKQNILPKFKHWLDEWLDKILCAQTPDANGKTLHNAQSALGAALIAIGVLAITKEKHFPGWWALLPTIGAALIISAGCEAWLNRVVLSNRALVWFGLISFPLYLWHWPLLSFARLMEIETTSYKMECTAVLISIVLAWLTYILIEKPIRFGNHSKTKTSALFLLMLVVGGTGYYCYHQDGLEFRFSKTLQAIVRYKLEDPTNMWRAGTCHLLPKQDYTIFDTCKVESNKDKKTTLLWGDSHAAHLYPGYKTFFGENLNIIQRTASSCQPILNLEIDGSPHCKKINDAVFELIKLEKPNKIVLSAVWSSYDWKKIEETITLLHEIGITDIDLIGPVPRWKDTLAKQLYSFYKNDKLHRIPERMKYGLDPGFLELDSVLTDFSKQLNINYISPAKILCNDDGCITRTGETRDTLTAFDAAHLTENGSRLLVAQFPKK